MSSKGAEIATRYRERRDADPDRRRKYLEKERDKWKKDRETGKKKSVNELSEREKRAKRKNWREVRSQARARKKCRDISCLCKREDGVLDCPRFNLQEVTLADVPVSSDEPSGCGKTPDNPGRPETLEVTEGTDGESMEAVSEPGPSVDVGDPERVRKASPSLSEHGEDYKPGNETVDTVLVRPVCSPGSPSESEKEETVEVKTEEEFEVKTEEEFEMKTEEEFESNEEHVAVKDDRCGDSPAAPDASEDTNMHKTSEELANTNTDTKECVDTQQEKEAAGGKLRVSVADDLDEMMDIGIVDQVEQEAQMNEEQQNSEMDMDGSRSPSCLNTASATEDGNSAEEEVDVKPTILPPPVEEEKVALDSVRSSLSPSSEATASTGRDSSSPATVMNGMKVVKLSIPRLDTVSESVRVATQTAKSSPSPPLVKVKDEPIDEEYEHALISSAFTASVKDEPDTAKEDLRIGSVFSVPPATERQPRPIVHPLSPHMCCCHCKKSLMKGQTAFQRKGSPALFCSTICLTTSLPSGRVTKICHNCQKLIIRPQDVILAPDAKGTMKEFCSQNCLTSFNSKKNLTNFKTLAPTKTTPQPLAPQSLCSMCTRFCISKHEVILSGAVHKICSDACFNRFRTVNNLSMAGCANCGSYCHSKPLMLKLEDSNKTLCNAECLAKYKENTKITKPCTMCRTTRLLVKMVDNKNSDDSVNLFCSSSCVMAFKVQTVSASGARLNCDSCGKNTVPAYHLAMSDTSIRNFCTLPCVMAFQEKFKKSQKQVNVFTKLPIGAAQIQSVTPIQTLQDVTKGPLKLKCFQCDSNIAFKPELLQIKDKLVFFCGMDCAHEFKKDNFVTSLCEYCKIEKITRDAKRINNRDCFFCSDGCKLLFRHDLTKNWGKHCHSCVYCHSMSKKLVTAQYGGSTEDFCSEDCRSKYTMLFCHVAKCDTCGHKGKLKQSLPMLGEVKHFCDLSCLLHFCCDTVATQGEIITGEATPVIANVISLAGPLTRKSNASQQQHTGTVFQSKNSGHISIQTDAVKVHPPPAPKILKNKAVLCRPLVQNKGVSCTTQTVDVEAQTDDVYPKILVVPVPVPVYIPVPMNMYSQFTPKALGLPLPVPVPVFLPVTMDSAERIMETIQEIKQKIPSDPFEAELILMAEMVAEQNEKNDKEEGPKEKKVSEKEKEKPEAAAPDDHGSNFSDDLDTDDLASFLNNWEDGSSDAGLRSPGRLCGQEKLNPILDIPAGATSEPYSEPPPPAPPPMDVEADFAVETLERMARLREQSQQSPSPPPAASRRRQAHRKAREKKGRKSQRSSKGAEASTQKGGANKAVAPDVPKLESQYGVDAWKRWIQWRQTQPNLEKPRFGSRPMELKDDVLRCTTAELSYGLCCFITELKRPNGEPYSPDSLFYLCLGIQQYLFENGRVENIFMDRFYNKFSTEFNNMLRDFKPSITASGYIHSRVEEGFLWDCKQLGAYSPIVLLNTLLFFCCKYFGFTTVEQHRQLSFAHVMRCTKTNPNNTKTTFLRFYPPISINEAETDPEVPVKKRKEEESKEDILEMMENTENPLRCPVRLYEFYLSKCSESVKQRTNLFYLHPERCCVPNSPLWFSFTPLDDGTMEGMLVRILTIRELHLGKRKAEGMEQKTSEDPPFIPPGEEGDGDSEG
ncbi:zinc finger MYM-type protein 4-like isoform X2 [Cyclopterus lumpus]|uniref:zinc finger MYM-type protein 4-like isoform X2 n=1 Tax=Cyclopterus lumpus TaxID=8103 RepID=UPI001486FDF6|nr:zinc finger MYM-type protein 4-like isoform X2 [Cyclopterus lumpus]